MIKEFLSNSSNVLSIVSIVIALAILLDQCVFSNYKRVKYTVKLRGNNKCRICLWNSGFTMIESSEFAAKNKLRIQSKYLENPKIIFQSREESDINIVRESDNYFVNFEFLNSHFGTIIEFDYLGNRKEELLSEEIEILGFLKNQGIPLMYRKKYYFQHKSILIVYTVAILLWIIQIPIMYHDKTPIYVANFISVWVFVFIVLVILFTKSLYTLKIPRILKRKLKE